MSASMRSRAASDRGARGGRGSMYVFSMLVLGVREHGGQLDEAPSQRTDEGHEEGSEGVGSDGVDDLAHTYLSAVRALDLR